jgi:rare lipoprotein A
VPQRPDLGLPSQLPFTVASLNYADERVSSAATAFAALESAPMSSDDVIQAWKRLNPSQATNSSTDYVAAGTFGNANEARQIAAHLSEFGRTEIERSQLDGKDWYSVNVYRDGRGSIDDLLQAAWANGAPDALAVRD